MIADRRRSRCGHAACAVALAGALLAAAPALARVERVEILAREPLAGGEAFGATGPYERLEGRLHYALDPADPANRRIVDLELAPRDTRGLVTFAGDFLLLKPIDLARGNHRLLYEVGNRGTLGMLAFFDDAPWTNDPMSAADLGNGFLLRQGYSLLWSAWNWDVLPGDGRLQIELPVAADDGAPITGPVAAEFVLMERAQSAPFMWGNSRGYPPLALDEEGALLTVRDEQRGVRIPIPRAQWRFDGPDRLFHAPGFEPGRIYELVYTARDPRVVGLGLAAIRDALSFFRFAAADQAGTANPLAPGGAPDPAAALAFGISQSGRVLQHMLLEALHVDEAGRMVFDGALIHVAGGGKGSFNHRFAQTTRHPSHLEDHQYPADFFPFATTPQQDPVTGAKGDVLAQARAAGALPKLVYTMTSTEYWTRSASLLHADVEGALDLPLAANARLYVFAGAQHGNWRSPWRGPYRNCGNPLDHRPPMRALLLALDAWARRATPPPESVFPRLADGTLGSVAEYRAAFPRVRGVMLPEGNLQPPRLDLGPRFATAGIADRQPPAFGPPFVTRVPLPDRDGNDRGGLRLPELAAPLGTYTGWNLRRPEVGAPDKLARWSGSFIPFARTEAERRAAGDPRPSLEARYRSRSDYEGLIEAAARRLADQGFLLETEIGEITGKAGAFYERLRAQDPKDYSCAFKPMIERSLRS
ncbi:MAG TPA: alpha/beta hydrolase domain-containing protein, partial [Geminicoccaceae bacterium]|nr:alpha/beta hydrolase domain-containing protein [Geminicoccaceae bacterium]